MEIQLAQDVPGIGKAGERVTLALQPSDVHDPSEIPTYLAGYKPFGYRADEASAPILVDKDEDKYRTFDSDDAFKVVNVKTSSQAAVPEVDPKSSLTNYKVVDRFVGAFIPTVTELNSSNPNYEPRMAAARRCRRAIDLDREVDVFALLGTLTNWDASVRTAITGGNEWDDQTNGDPILDIQTAIEKSWQPVTEIWMNQVVAHLFLRHTKVREHMKQMMGENAVAGAAANVAGAGNANVDFRITGLPVIRVVASKYKNESTGALAPVLSSDVVVLTTVPVGVPNSGEEIASTHTFRRRGPSGVGFEAREYFVPGRGPLGGTMVVVSMADIAVMTGSKAGGIITNISP